MAGNKHYSSLYLVGRSLLPSVTSGVLCVCFGIALVIVNFLLLSLNLGTSLPQLFDGQWATAYTNTVVQPLLSLFNNLTFNNVMLLALWGLAGLATYFLLEYSAHLYHGWRNAQKDIQIVGKQIIYHPARRSFWMTVAWRTTVLVITALLFIALLPVIQQLLETGPSLVLGSLPLATSLRELVFLLVGWTLVAHAFVVVLRLLSLRTRLFGDPAIE